MSDLEEELSILLSFYCQPGEFKVTEFGNAKHIEVHLKQENANSNPVHIDVDVRVPESYPDTLPDILLSSPQLKRDILTIIRKDATECANQFKGESNNMIFNLLQNIQENLNKLCVNECTEEDIKTEETIDVWNVLLNLDHMRSKSKYIKTIQKWTQELDLQGRLIFYRKLIFILLQGEYSNIKEYIVRQRSINIDVDSHGRSCKERMMSILGEEKATGKKRFTDFTVEECDSVEKMTKIFSDFDLTSIYCKYIMGVYI